MNKIINLIEEILNTHDREYLNDMEFNKLIAVVEKYYKIKLIYDNNNIKLTYDYDINNVQKNFN